MKLNLSQDAIKDFCIQHVEKFVLGLCVLLMGYFIWSGYGITPYEETPAKLSQAANRSQEHVNNNTWEQLLTEDSRDPARDFEQEAALAQYKVTADPYRPNGPLSPILQRPLVKRTDPEIYPPLKLEVAGTFGALALPQRSSPLADLPPGKLEFEMEKPKPKPKEKKRRGAAGGMMEGMMGGMMEGMDGMEGGGQEEIQSPFEMGGMEGMMGGMEGGDGLGGMAAQLVRNRVGEYAPGGGSGLGGGSGMEGMMEGMAEGMGGGASGATQKSALPLSGRSVYLIALNALVPYEKQVNQFQDILQDSAGGDPMRDAVKYIGYVVQRAEVTDPDAPVESLEWKEVRNGRSWLAIPMVNKWGAPGPEIAHADYLMPKTLTMPVPPLMWRELDAISNHSEIPLRFKSTSAKQQTDSADVAIDPLAAAEGTGLPPVTAAGTPGMQGMGMEGMGMGGMGMEGMGMEGMGMGGMGMEGMGMGAEGGGMEGMGGMGMGGMMEGMMGMMNGDGFGGPKVTDHKLLRFFDYSAQPGKTYRYRVQLWVEDPNRPRSGDLDERMLDADVLKRLQDVAKEEATLKTRVYWRKTEWSEPSPPVKIPTTERFFVGDPVKRKLSDYVMTESGGLIPSKPEAARVAAVVWDQKLAVDVPVTKDVIRGSVFNYNEDANIVDPVSLEVKKLEAYQFRNDGVLLDLRGGIPTSRDRDKPIQAPAAMALIDSEGNLIVRDELSDVDPFRQFSYENERPNANAGGMPGMEGGEAGMEGMGMEGMGGMGLPPGMMEGVE